MIVIVVVIVIVVSRELDGNHIVLPWIHAVCKRLNSQELAKMLARVGSASVSATRHFEVCSRCSPESLRTYTSHYPCSH